MRDVKNVNKFFIFSDWLIHLSNWANFLQNTENLSILVTNDHHVNNSLRLSSGTHTYTKNLHMYENEWLYICVLGVSILPSISTILWLEILEMLQQSGISCFSFYPLSNDITEILLKEIHDLISPKIHDSMCHKISMSLNWWIPMLQISRLTVTKLMDLLSLNLEFRDTLSYEFWDTISHEFRTVSHEF
jgi:hypothetical protein